MQRATKKSALVTSKNALITSKNALVTSTIAHAQFLHILYELDKTCIFCFNTALFTNHLPSYGRRPYVVPSFRNHGSKYSPGHHSLMKII